MAPIEKTETASGQRGFSLMELLIVLSIVVIVSAMAIAQLQSARHGFSRQNAAIELKNGFERARFDSVKRRAADSNTEAKVIVGATWFTVVTDNDGNGVTTDPADSVTTDLVLRESEAAHLSESMTGEITVSFNQRGETSTAGASTPYFRVCSGACTIANNDPAGSTVIIVTPTGTVNLLPGGSAVPVFAAPSPLTQVPSDTDIRSFVTVP